MINLAIVLCKRAGYPTVIMGIMTAVLSGPNFSL